MPDAGVEAPPPDCTPVSWTNPGMVATPELALVAADAGETGMPFEQRAGLDEYDYVMEEYFFTGTSPAYTTRMVVRRPRDPAKFSGTVFAEWCNVSGGRGQRLARRRPQPREVGSGRSDPRRQARHDARRRARHRHRCSAEHVRQPDERVPVLSRYNAALDWLQRWVRSAERPPAGVPFQTTGSQLTLDQHGNALGGVRLRRHHGPADRDRAAGALRQPRRLRAEVHRRRRRRARRRPRAASRPRRGRRPGPEGADPEVSRGARLSLRTGRCRARTGPCRPAFAGRASPRRARDSLRRSWVTGRAARPPRAWCARARPAPTPRARAR